MGGIDHGYDISNDDLSYVLPLNLYDNPTFIAAE